MKQSIKLIATFLLLAILVPVQGNTQVLEDLKPFDDGMQIIPKIEENIVPPTPRLPSPSEWIRIARGMDCNSLAYIKSLLDARGQILWVAGGFSGTSSSDPFNGLVIVRDPVTLEYTALLIKAEIDIACVIHSGQAIRAVDEQ
jgi:hypothetical protein